MPQTEFVGRPATVLRSVVMDWPLSRSEKQLRLVNAARQNAVTSRDCSASGPLLHLLAHRLQAIDG